MSMKRKMYYLVIIALILGALLWSSCGKEPSYEDRETFAPEILTPVEGTEVILQDGLTAADFPKGETVGDWLSGCSRPDRDEHFQAYTLRREITEGENTTFTYLIYYPHGDGVLQAKPALSQTDGGYIIDLVFEAGQGVEGYSLCYLSVTLPTDKTPRLRLRRGYETLGVMSTVTQADIPDPTAMP
jgi:hypothetical protein